LLQAVINANIIGPLVQLLQTAEFDIKKEAAWAISNATSGGTHDQIKYGNFFVIYLNLLCSMFLFP
jgi:importin subunit alpha-6/7